MLMFCQSEYLLFNKNYFNESIKTLEITYIIRNHSRITYYNEKINKS